MIEVKDLKAGYGGRAIIEIPELQIQKNKITCILGKNGCGKSTFLKALDHQISGDGSIFIEEKNIKDFTHQMRAKEISYLPQFLPPVKMTVKTLVSHGRFAYTSIGHQLTSEDEEKIQDAMKLCDVKELEHRYLEELSGGERSRAYLAMVIAQDSKYILLDEPDSDYDLTHQMMLANILESLVKQGKGIVLTTHDILFGLSVGNEICLMKDGEILGRKTPDQLVVNDDILRASLGVGVVRTTVSDSLYKYQLTK